MTPNENTVATIIITLWYNFEIYQCTVYPTAVYTEYSCNNATISYIGASCNSETKMLFDNSGSGDAFGADNIFFTTTDGTLFGVDDVCISDTMPKGKLYNAWYLNDTQCNTGYSHYSAVCVDNDHLSSSVSCAPEKQLVYFDTNTPNTYITGAILADGSNVTIDISTGNCTNDYPTTSQPATSNPTTSLPTTSIPTTSIPTTSIPTTANPTDNPTRDPTTDPTKGIFVFFLLCCAFERVMFSACCF